MTAFTVKSVGEEPREWQSSHGTFLSYNVDLEHPDGKLAKGVEWTKKPESQAPEVGEEVIGHLEEGKYSERFKIDYEATKELHSGNWRSSSQSHETSSGAPRAAKGNWQPESERDPERAARILRQHSQEMALRFLTLSNFKADATNDANVQVGLSFVAQLADFFDQDVIQAGQAADSAQGAPPAAKEGAVPSSPSASPGSSSSPADLSEMAECARALDTAGLVFPAARDKVAEYMMTMPEPDRIRAMRQLVNAAELEMQAVTLRAMKQRTENWSKEPLPSDGGVKPFEDDIPFARPEYRELFTERERWRF